jgi:NAD(P)-dependent dehydrogenase (short-subunit alcohol dehydrogenase family)
MAAATAAAAAHAAPSAEWRGRLVLVTGSTMGIGKGIAAHFVGLGARVIVNGRSAEAVQKVVDSLRPLCPPVSAPRAQAWLRTRALLTATAAPRRAERCWAQWAT